LISSPCIERKPDTRRPFPKEQPFVRLLASMHGSIELSRKNAAQNSQARLITGSKP